MSSDPLLNPCRRCRLAALVGYIYDIHLAEHVKLGVGGLGSLFAVPKGLQAAYGSAPASWMAFLRLKIY